MERQGARDSHETRERGKSNQCNNELSKGQGGHTPLGAAIWSWPAARLSPGGVRAPTTGVPSLALTAAAEASRGSMPG